MRFLVRSSLSGCESSAMRGINFPSWFTIPMNLRTSVMVVGGGILRMASTLLGSGDTPLALTT